MIRTNGFARKTRRLTKGGSLPKNARIRSFSSSIFRYFVREKTLERSLPEQPGGNGVSPSGSNGSKEHFSSDNERAQLASGASTDLRNLDNDNVSQLLEGVVAKLVSPEDDAGTDLDLAVRMPRWKRSLDIACILLTLPLWLPIMILVMAWIRIVSPGPVFYRQERVGYRRDHFMIFKFRTMHVNAETRTHEEYFAHLMRVDCPMTKLDTEGDSRLINCGRFLRSSGLDELPQIFNVLRGDMSLVGPRPCLPVEFERYEAWHRSRVNVLPGLTGYWQVNGKNKTTFSEMIAMDIFYGQNMSLWTDLTIILKTIPALIEQTLESRAQNRVNGARERSVVAEGLGGSVRKI
jgi:exopolysaccharide production protein ExoY